MRHSVPADSSFSPAGKTAWDAVHVGLDTTSVSGADAATVMGTETFYRVDMSAWTADRDYTLPASPTVGDRVGVMVTVGSASWELIIKGNTGQTINGGSAASEWSRLFITAEAVILRYVATNKWSVEYDGRIPSVCRLERTTAQSISTATLTTIALNGELFDRGEIGNTINNRSDIRRAGRYSVKPFGRLAGAAADGNQLQARAVKNGTDILTAQAIFASAASNALAPGAPEIVTLAAGDYVELVMFHNYGTAQNTETTAGLRPSLTVAEEL